MICSSLVGPLLFFTLSGILGWPLALNFRGINDKGARFFRQFPKWLNMGGSDQPGVWRFTGVVFAIMSILIPVILLSQTCSL